MGLPEYPKDLREFQQRITSPRLALDIWCRVAGQCDLVHRSQPYRHLALILLLHREVQVLHVCEYGYFVQALSHLLFSRCPCLSRGQLHSILH